MLSAIVGTTLLINTHAQTPYVASEAETGTLSCSASQDKDPSASGGGYVQFGGAPTSAVGTTSQTSAVALSVPLHFDDTQWNWPSQAGGYSRFTINVVP